YDAVAIRTELAYLPESCSDAKPIGLGRMSLRSYLDRLHRFHARLSEGFVGGADIKRARDVAFFRLNDAAQIRQGLAGGGADLFETIDNQEGGGFRSEAGLQKWDDQGGVAGDLPQGADRMDADPRGFVTREAA